MRSETCCHCFPITGNLVAISKICSHQLRKPEIHVSERKPKLLQYHSFVTVGYLQEILIIERLLDF